MSWEVIGKVVVAKPVLTQCGVIWAKHIQKNSDPWQMEGTFDPWMLIYMQVKIGDHKKLIKVKGVR